MRWILFLPLGVYELFLLIISWALVSMSERKLATKIYLHAQNLPGIDWYKNEGK